VHEMSIALNIIDIAQEHAKQYHAKKVNRIDLEIGDLSGIETDPLLNALHIAINGTILENSDIHIETIAPRAQCERCQAEFELEDFTFNCPQCNHHKIDIIKGKELSIKSLDVE